MQDSAGVQTEGPDAIFGFHAARVPMHGIENGECHHKQGGRGHKTQTSERREKAQSTMGRGQGAATESCLQYLRNLQHCGVGLDGSGRQVVEINRARSAQ